MTVENSSPSVVSKRHPDDCLPCRLVSGFGVVGIGAYLYYTGRSWPNKSNRIVINTLALGACGLGVARLLDLPPFRKQHTK